MDVSPQGGRLAYVVRTQQQVECLQPVEFELRQAAKSPYLYLMQTIVVVHGSCKQ